MMANDIGNQQAFASELVGGMTYRQWLIGQALAGGDDAGAAVGIADEVLIKLAGEQTQDDDPTRQ